MASWVGWLFCEGGANLQSEMSFRFLGGLRGAQMRRERGDRGERGLISFPRFLRPARFFQERALLREPGFFALRLGEESYPARFSAASKCFRVRSISIAWD